MKYLIIAIIVAVLSGCTTTGDLDWDVASKEMHLAALDLEHAAQLVDDEGLQESLIELGELLELASQAAGGAIEDDPLAAIRVALDFTNALADQLAADAAQFVRISVFAAQAALRRYEAYAPKDE